jgi:hypothetical protein
VDSYPTIVGFSSTKPFIKFKIDQNFTTAKKTKMNKLYLIVFFFLLFISACNKETDEMDEGRITGPDLRECACCGGWFIEISDSTYRFYDLPPNSDLNLEKESFPIDVELIWKIDKDACMGDEILVEFIRKKHS